MRKILLMLTATTALAAATQAQAMPLGGNGLNTAIDSVATVDKAAFVYEGSRYCFYFNGWHGAGWYRCGFAFRRGLGWGGEYGWNSWRDSGWERRHGRHERRGEVHTRGNIRSGDNVETRGSVTTRSRTRTDTHIGRSGGQVRGTTGMGSRSGGSTGGAHINAAPGGGGMSGGASGGGHVGGGGGGAPAGGGAAGGAGGAGDMKR